MKVSSKDLPRAGSAGQEDSLRGLQSAATKVAASNREGTENFIMQTDIT